MKAYALITGIVFAIVAIVHILRIVQGWDITVAGSAIPMWVSWIGLIVSAVLSYYGFHYNRRLII